MAYSLTPGVPLGEALRAVVDAEVEASLVSLGRARVVGDPDAVHDVRKRSKKLRALALAVSGSVPRRRWRAAYRAAGEAARSLADSRDAQVRLVTLTALVADRQAEFADALAHATGALRPAATAEGRADAVVENGGTTGKATGAVAGSDDERVQHASWLLTGVAAEVATWEVDDRFAALAGGVGDTYRDGRQRWRALERALETASGDVSALDAHALHRWRRSVKYRWYHTRLLAPVAPDLLGAEAVLLDEVGEALGVDHDLAVLVDAMTAAPGPWGGPAVVGEVGRLADARQATLRLRALELGRQLYALPTRTHLARLGTWWQEAHRAAGRGSDH